MRSTSGFPRAHVFTRHAHVRARRKDAAWNTARLAALTIAAVIVFLVLTAFVYDLWAVAAGCAVLFTAGLWMLAAWAWGRISLVFSYTLPILIFLPLWGALQLLTDRSVYRFATFSSVLLLAGAAVCYWVTAEAYQVPAVLTGMRRFFVLFSILVALLAIVQLLTSRGRVFWTFDVHWVDHPMASFLNRDRYSAFVELLFPLTLVKVLTSKERWTLYALSAGVMYASVVAGGSRAGLIGITFELFVALAFYARNRAGSLSRLRIALVIVILTAALAAAVGWQNVAKRFSESDPLAGRRAFLVSSLHMFRERPWMGFGLGTWPSVYPAFAIIDPGKLVNHAHDDWAEWACDGGLPFVLAWLLIAGRTAVHALRSPEALGVTVVFIHSLVDFNFYNYPIVIIVTVLIAASEAERGALRFANRATP